MLLLLTKVVLVIVANQRERKEVYNIPMSKKKRNKKYRPADATPEASVVHRYVAEDEEKSARAKRFKRRFIGVGVISALLALLLALTF